MKPFVTVDYSGSSIPNSANDGESPAFCCSWRYSTPGTSEGEWYLPSYYDVMKYQQNYAVINTVLTNIKNVVGTSYLNTINSNIIIAAENDLTHSYSVGSTLNPYFPKYNAGSSVSGVRPVFIAGVKEI